MSAELFRGEMFGKSSDCCCIYWSKVFVNFLKNVDCYTGQLGNPLSRQKEHMETSSVLHSGLIQNTVLIADNKKFVNSKMSR